MSSIPYHAGALLLPFCLWGCLLPPCYKPIWLVCCSLSCFLVVSVSCLPLALQIDTFAALCLLLITLIASILSLVLLLNATHLPLSLTSISYVALIIACCNLCKICNIIVERSMYFGGTYCIPIIASSRNHHKRPHILYFQFSLECHTLSTGTSC